MSIAKTLFLVALVSFAMSADTTNSTETNTNAIVTATDDNST